MGIISSFVKSSKLRKLQSEIAPRDGASAMDLFKDACDASKTQKKEAALEAYLDLCEGDPNVSFVMERYSLQREDLKRYSMLISASGAGGWIKGHYTPLSSIAYGEPLIFLAETTKSKRWSNAEIGFRLMSYWEGEIKQGGLIAALKEPG